MNFDNVFKSKWWSTQSMAYWPLLTCSIIAAMHFYGLHHICAKRWMNIQSISIKKKIKNECCFENKMFGIGLKVMFTVACKNSDYPVKNVNPVSKNRMFHVDKKWKELTSFCDGTGTWAMNLLSDEDSLSKSSISSSSSSYK